MGVEIVGREVEMSCLREHKYNFLQVTCSENIERVLDSSLANQNLKTWQYLDFRFLFIISFH